MGRLPFDQIAWMLDGPDLNLAVPESESLSFEAISVRRGAYSPGDAAGFVRDRLLALPRYARGLQR